MTTSQPTVVTQSPNGLLPNAVAERSHDLSLFTVQQMASEIVARMREEHVWQNDSALLAVGNQLLHGMREQMQVHNNRFSLTRYRDLFQGMYASMPDRPPLDGATVVDIGCGGTNPGAFLFLLLLLGAKRGIAIDLDQIQHPLMALQALSDLAAAMMIDPAAIVGNLAPSRHEILQNIQDVDLAKLSRGDISGISADRLTYWQQSASAITLADGAADIIFSNAFLEHVPEPEEVIREMARITKAGGIGVHAIDLTDHRRYRTDCHPLQFLTEPGPGMLHGSNRMRLSHWVTAFAANGFTIRASKVLVKVSVEQRTHLKLSPAYRDLPESDLEAGIIRLVMQRR
ncbi:MAG: SAM-dependent methyltransferase [Planctomycetota bacterium]|jgi:SAM-dependent methyltransferase